MSWPTEIVPLDRVDGDPLQPRGPLDREELIRLTKNIQARGQLQPAIVFRQEDRFGLVDGHRRVQALLLLKRTELWAVVLERAPAPDELLTLQLAMACHRSDLKPLEKARAFERLKAARNWSNTELAEALQLSKGTVTQCLSYLTLPPEAQAAVDAGRLSGSTAYAIARAPDPTTREALTAAAVDGNLTREEACRSVRRRGGGRRVVCRLAGATLTIASEQPLGLPELDALALALRKQVRAAKAQGFDVRTFERVLADQQRAALG